MKRLLAALLATAALTCACTSSGGDGRNSTSASPSGSPTGSSTGQPTGLGGGNGETSSPSTNSPTTTAPRTTPSRSTAAGPVRELPGPCPYLSAEDARQTEGDRVGNVFRLSTNPVGCRFYFAYDDTAIVLEITFRLYPSNDAALASLVALANRTPGFVRDTDIGDGAISVKADLQGNLTWECNFAKGRYVITVHTRQPDPSFNARQIARQIAPKVP